MNQPPQGQPPQGAPVQRANPIYKPEQMLQLPGLSDEEKTKYERGLRQLYNLMQTNDPSSPAHASAKQKIEDFSTMVFKKIEKLRQQAAGQRWQQGGLQAAQAAQAAQRPGANAAPGAAQPNTAAVNRPAGAPGVTNAAGAANPAAAAGQPKPSEAIMKHVNEMTYIPPPNVMAQGQEAAQKWVQAYRSKYMQALMKMEQVSAQTRKLEATVKEREAKGNPLNPEELNNFKVMRERNQEAYGQCKNFIESFRKNQEAISKARQAASQAGAQGGAQPARPQAASVSQPNTSTAAPTNPMQAAAASVNQAMDIAKNQSLAAANRPQAPGQSQAPTTSTPTQAQAPAATAQQPQVKVEPGTQASNPQPPPVNTAVAAASGAQMPSAGTPTQASARVQTPQSANVANGGPRALSHQAALANANRQHSSNSVPSAGTGATSAGGATTPGAAGFNGAQGGHPHAHPQPIPTQSSIPAKMPINKNLPEKATAVPVPVSTGGGTQAGRPTMSGGSGVNGGVMGQPVMQKLPPYNFDTESDHVLSKKKLDELVRQVCGGGPPGADGNYLTPDVEESVLNVADNFVDTILHTACKLAKERGSKVLEIRDIQMVLERVYNIRIPGYTSDELRTVRKIQPSPAWIAKMSAVQAAKVMPGKDDK